FALLACVTVPAAALLEGRVGRGEEQLVRNSLAAQAELLAKELERAPPDDLASWAARFAEAGRPRVTVIALDGAVLGDRQGAREALASLENHGSRPEVVTARAGGVGSNARRSATLGKPMMYVAVPVGAPPRLVLRLALELGDVEAAISSAQSALWVAG